MSKREFLSQLREALEGNIPMSDIAEHTEFYDNYFKESDRSEEEVCEELGDPRLIARTVIDSFAASKGPMADYYMEQARSEYSRYERGEQEEGQTERWIDKLFRSLLFMAVVIVVAAVLLFLLRTALFVMLPVMIIVLFVKIIRDLFQRY